MKNTYLNLSLYLKAFNKQDTFQQFINNLVFKKYEKTII